MKLSPYILRKKVKTGELYFNSKNNHSFFITNDLLESIKINNDVKTQYNDYLLSHDYHEEINEFEITIDRIKDYEEKNLEFTILTHGDCNFRCKYCYEKFENIEMSKETENAIINFTKKYY